MPTTDLSAMAMAWLVAPAVLLVVSMGMGLLTGRISRTDLGFLTIPTGVLALVTIANGLLWLHLPPLIVVVAVMIATAAGFTLAYRGEDARWTALLRNDLIRPATLAACVTWVVGMAPLVLFGRVGVLGYIFNNDATTHIAIIEVLRDHGVGGLIDPATVPEIANGIYPDGYPTGSHALVMIAAMTTRAPAFHIWTPAIVFILACTTLTAFEYHRRFGSPRVVALAGSVFAGSCFLMYNYMLQGSLKEVLAAMAVLTTSALAVKAYEQKLAAPPMIPVALGIATMFATLGFGSVFWALPAAAAFVLICVVKPPSGITRKKAVIGAGAAAAFSVLLAAPLIAQAISFLLASNEILASKDEIGNLLGPLPRREMLGIWFNHDYRHAVPERMAGINSILSYTALAVAALGTGAAIVRRAWALPFALAISSIAAVVMVARLSIYFEAKAFVVLAPAVSIAIGYGIAYAVGGLRALRLPAYVTGVVLLGAAAVSLFFVYLSAWFTPTTRFEELKAAATRIEDGRASVLIADREEYGRVFFENNLAYEPWRVYSTAVKGLRIPGEISDPMRMPDIDEYLDSFVAKMNWIVVRRHPGASRPPGNFEFAWTGRYYEVWRRRGARPAERLPLGDPSTFWASPLDCGSQAFRGFMQRASGGKVRVSTGGHKPIEIGESDRLNFGPYSDFPLPGFIHRDGANSVIFAEPKLDRGATYDVYLRGHFNRGYSMSINRRSHGVVHDDLGLFTGWHPFGSFTAKGRGSDIITLVGLEKGAWRPGSLRPDVIGSIALVPRTPARRVVTLDADEVERFCGERIDWLERL